MADINDFDIIKRLLERNIHHVVLHIYSYLDFASLRRTLWVSQIWRYYILDNMDRIKFEEQEKKYIIDQIGNVELVVDSCHLSYKWSKAETRLAILMGGARSINEIWPPRLPSEPSDVETITYIFNKNYILNISKNDKNGRLIRQSRDSGRLNDIHLDKLFSLPLVKKTCKVSRSVSRTGTSTTTSTNTKRSLTVSTEPYRDCVFLHWEANRLSCFKMDSQAQNFILICGIQKGPNNTFCFLADKANNTSYILKLRKDFDKTTMALINISNGEQVWDRQDPLPPVEERVLQPEMADECVVVPILAHDISSERNFTRIRVFRLDSGSMLHEIEISDEPFPFCGISTRGKQLMLTSPNSNLGMFWGNPLIFNCYIIDLANKSPAPQKTLIEKPSSEIDVCAASFCGDNCAVACLARNFEPPDIRGLASVQCPEAFVSWDTNTGATLRTVLLREMAMAYCLGEFWITKRTDHSGEDRTLLELWTFNRSLDLLAQLKPELRKRPVGEKKKEEPKGTDEKGNLIRFLEWSMGQCLGLL